MGDHQQDRQRLELHGRRHDQRHEPRLEPTSYSESGRQKSVWPSGQRWGSSPQRPSGCRLKHTSELCPWCQERYSSPCGFREPAATFAPTPKLAVCGLLAAAGGELVDVAVQLLGGHPGARVGDRQLAHAAARGVESQPVHVPHDPAAGDRALGVDRVEPVDGQLAQALQVGAFAAEPLEQERGVRNGEFVPAVQTACRPGRELRRAERAALPSRRIGTGQASKGPPLRDGSGLWKGVGHRRSPGAVHVDDR